ncbi:hypothetical protein HK099_008508 [Clydaea vesicula]|uniref:Poly(A) RNA polymerase mitochondrial-like central palm domain-containing protein n=1 Tax=Clydaea vesicula TaxID=447962 RepID=A0AAD5U665_9FUNG|nr:hypothetical protein HK099_008508 [Clydaea vesicula]
MVNNEFIDVSLATKPTGNRFFEELTDPFYSSEPCQKTLTQTFEENITVEVSELHQRLNFTLEIYNMRLDFLKKIQGIIDLEWPDKDVKAHLFGSTISGLGSVNSDVDIVLITSWDDRINGVSNMNVIASCLKKHGMTNIYTVSAAKVPICKFFDQE